MQNVFGGKLDNNKFIEYLDRTRDSKLKNNRYKCNKLHI